MAIKKKLGIGTLALVLAIVAIIWGIQVDTGTNVHGVGIFVLRAIGLGQFGRWILNMLYWFTYLFTIPAIVIGRRHPEHFEAKAGGDCCLDLCRLLPAYVPLVSSF